MIRIWFPIRIFCGFLLGAALLSTGGCMYSQMKAGSTRPVERSLEVVVHSAIEQHTMEKVCVLIPDSTAETAPIAEAVASDYQTNLLQRRPFREIRLLNRQVKSDSEALWHARNAGFDLVMVPAVVYVMDGTGAMPTKLSVRTRILDARTGMVLWDIRQTAFSEPGADIDLYWNSFAGQPAQRVSKLIEALAGQFADFLIAPLEKEKQGLPSLDCLTR